jgi:hypothetical protein
MEGFSVPTREQVFFVADRIRAKGELVSARSVRKALPRGGSFKDVCPHLSVWKTERAYQPRIEQAVLPEGLQNKLVKFGQDVWEEAMREATNQLLADRENMEAALTIERQLRDEAAAAADAFEARIEAAEKAAADLALELGRAQEQVRGLTRKLANVRPTGEGAAAIKKAERERAGTFWDHVMTLANGLMLASGKPVEMTTAELVERLPEAVKGEACRWGETLDASKLGARMGTRVNHGKLFARGAAKGTFRPLPPKANTTRGVAGNA